MAPFLYTEVPFPLIPRVKYDDLEKTTIKSKHKDQERVVEIPFCKDNEPETIVRTLVELKNVRDGWQLAVEDLKPIMLQVLRGNPRDKFQGALSKHPDNKKETFDQVLHDWLRDVLLEDIHRQDQDTYLGSTTKPWSITNEEFYERLVLIGKMVKALPVTGKQFHLDDLDGSAYSDSEIRNWLCSKQPEAMRSQITLLGKRNETDLHKLARWLDQLKNALNVSEPVGKTAGSRRSKRTWTDKDYEGKDIRRSKRQKNRQSFSKSKQETKEPECPRHPHGRHAWEDCTYNPNSLNYKRWPVFKRQSNNNTKQQARGQQQKSETHVAEQEQTESETLINDDARVAVEGKRQAQSTDKQQPKRGRWVNDEDDMWNYDYNHHIDHAGEEEEQSS
jgi:hypothetical protein